MNLNLVICIAKHLSLINIEYHMPDLRASGMKIVRFGLCGDTRSEVQSGLEILEKHSEN